MTQSEESNTNNNNFPTIEEEKKTLYHKLQRTAWLSFRDCIIYGVICMLTIAFLGINVTSQWWYEAEQNTGQKIPSMKDVMAYDPKLKQDIHNPFITAIYSVEPAIVYFDSNGTKVAIDYTGKTPKADKAMEEFRWISALLTALPFVLLGNAIYTTRRIERLRNKSVCKNCKHTIAAHVDVDGNWRQKGCNAPVRAPTGTTTTEKVKALLNGKNRCFCNKYEDGGTRKRKVAPVSYIILGWIIFLVLWTIFAVPAINHISMTAYMNPPELKGLASSSSP